MIGKVQKLERGTGGTPLRQVLIHPVLRNQVDTQTKQPIDLKAVSLSLA